MSSTDLLRIDDVELRRGSPQLLKGSQEAAVAAHWRDAVENNPALFNGPVISPIRTQVAGRMCTLEWYCSDYAHYLFSRQNPESPEGSLIGTVFVSVVVPTTDGRFVVGRMSQQTSAPGAVQLPGGGVSIRPEQSALSRHDLALAAVREAGEEMGINMDPGSLRIWGVIRRKRPLDVGVVFTSEPQPWEDIEEAFIDLRERELSVGAVPEFDELFPISPSADLARLPGGLGRRAIDYLPAVMRVLSSSEEGAV